MMGSTLYSRLERRRGDRAARCACICAVALACVVLAVLPDNIAQAAGPIGPTGPLGPVGPVGPVGPARTDGERPEPRPAQPAPPSPSARSAASNARLPRGADAGNRIEVTGNRAAGSRCAADGTTSVNSVDVSGAQLDGRTVIVQGRNSHDVRVRECPAATVPPAHDQGGTGHTNSIRIR